MKTTTFFRRTYLSADATRRCWPTSWLSRVPLSARLGVAVLLLVLTGGSGQAAPTDNSAALQRDFDAQIRPLLEQYCFECHSNALAEAEVDLEAFASLAEVRKNVRIWQKVGEMLDSRQMPPKKAAQPENAERALLQSWTRQFLTAEAAARAGDPGRVVLRRLNNAEYTYTLRDLTGVESLDPARQFPVDGAAGEGFTNTGSSLSMSPALVSKNLDAANEVANHVVLLPDGFRFSRHSSRRDWTEEALSRIREFYSKDTDPSSGTAVNLQGIRFETNKGGRLPVEKYLAATLRYRDELASGRTKIHAVARETGLNSKYLETLWRALAGETSEPSLLLDRLRARWHSSNEDGAAALTAEIARWQQVLWKFNSVGHIGKHLGRKDGPQAWLESVTPLIARQDVRLKLEPPEGQQEITLYLVAGDAGDGRAHDFVVWENPRLVAPGRADLPLRDLRAVAAALAARREQLFASVAKCLAAAAQVDGSLDASERVARLARQHGIEPEILAAWFDYLGIGGGAARIDEHLTQRRDEVGGYNFVKGWVGPEALSVLANSSDQPVRVPGNMKPRGVAVHPSPARRVIVGWRSSATQVLRIEAAVQHAHPECGNGVTWTLELRRGKTRQRLAGGTANGPAAVKAGPIDNVAAQPGDVIALAISPRDANHSCDLTAIDLTLKGSRREWDLARDVSPDILAGNPHADRFGEPGVWHFYSEPDRGPAPGSIPAGSVLARWQATPSPHVKQMLANELQQLLNGGGARLPKDSPDAVLYRQLSSLSGPLLAALRDSPAARPLESAPTDRVNGLDPAQFGRHPAGAMIDERSLCVQAPATIAMRLPADLVAGCEFVTAGVLHQQTGAEGSVQLEVRTTPPETADLSAALPVVVRESSASRRRFATAFEDMRQLFPAALCYAKIVPVDEVVTLTLFHREDDHLQRLMLDDRQVEHLDRLWDELFYVSQEPFLLATAFEQLAEYATQDRPDMVSAFEPMRGPINARAAAFRQRLLETESKHMGALMAFARRAYRRPLTESDAQSLREFYANLRKQELGHEEAFRLTLVRVLMSPAFLYRVENPPPGTVQQPVSDHELACRLSYFLWSSLPDDELFRVAVAGRLRNSDVLLAQTRRMCRDPKIRRLASEFAAQWLHIYNFDQHDEKSERHFPTFAGLRGAMYEESLRFFTDLFQNDGSVWQILDADHTFLNEELANHYGIPGVKGPHWRRVEGVKRFRRGGILTLAATLAQQSGASRTSPILRGNWLSEVVLGEKLPRPPKNVPQLADTVPAGLTERQLIERHSSDPACAKCHARIDPLGFALENFDAIGRYRVTDAAGLPIDSNTRLQDGTAIAGLDGLRRHVMTKRRDDFLRQFYRKLLGYALGRSVQLSDEPLLAQLRAARHDGDLRVSTAIETIVLSRQFREIRGRDAPNDE